MKAAEPMRVANTISIITTGQPMDLAAILEFLNEMLEIIESIDLENEAKTLTK
jgi:hypothetical protein